MAPTRSGAGSGNARRHGRPSRRVAALSLLSWWALVADSALAFAHVPPPSPLRTNYSHSGAASRSKGSRVLPLPHVKVGNADVIWGHLQSPGRPSEAAVKLALGYKGNQLQETPVRRRTAPPPPCTRCGEAGGGASAPSPHPPSSFRKISQSLPRLPPPPPRAACCYHERRADGVHPNGQTPRPSTPFRPPPTPPSCPRPALPTATATGRRENSTLWLPPRPAPPPSPPAGPKVASGGRGVGEVTEFTAVKPAQAPLRAPSAPTPPLPPHRPPAAVKSSPSSRGLPAGEHKGLSERTARCRGRAGRL